MTTATTKTPESVLRFYHPVATSTELRDELTTKLAGETYRVRRAGTAVRAECEAAHRRPRVLEHEGTIWLADARFPEPELPAVDFRADGFERAGTDRVVFPAPQHVAFDNFSEDEHTPWVHSFLGWQESAAAKVDFEYEKLEDRTKVRYRGIQRPHVLTPLILVRWGDTFHNAWVTTLDPVRTVYTLHWESPDGRRRPVTSRFAIYFVPLDERTTVLHVIAYAKIEAPFGFLAPVVHAVVPRIGASEVMDDQRFIHHVAETPFELTGMRLGKFDAPLVHNRRLMKRIYFGGDHDARATNGVA